ncbi:MBL fold metallo-hydrolase [Algivirga pacifica]|uniref:MBL fold metallo-hydrolase n=1 Tax=Algivirga pacifica TaxID=1162670 RepID=A0ABP9DGG2_9BACT
MYITESFQYEEVLGFKFGYQPIGKPNMFSHIYYVDGLLIDTGHQRVRKAVKKTVQELNVEQIFITHHHEDHTGNILPLQAIYGCEVYASEMCCELMKNPPQLSFAQKITWGDREAYQHLTPIENVIYTPNYTFQIIPIPGHAPDMVALYEPNKKWLFSADLFINTYIGYFIEDESIREQINSIQKIITLDFEVLFCSHNPQLSHGKERLVKKLHFLESFFEEVASLHKKGYSPDEIFKLLELKENWMVKILSGGKLSRLNMVRSVVRDLERSLINKE